MGKLWFTSEIWVIIWFDTYKDKTNEIDPVSICKILLGYTKNIF